MTVKKTTGYFEKGTFYEKTLAYDNCQLEIAINLSILHF